MSRVPSGFSYWLFLPVAVVVGLFKGLCYGVPFAGIISAIFMIVTYEKGAEFPWVLFYVLCGLAAIAGVWTYLDDNWLKPAPAKNGYSGSGPAYQEGTPEYYMRRAEERATNPLDPDYNGPHDYPWRDK